MVDESGKVVGHHEGLMYYTLGQRRGLGIGGGGTGERWFVIEKDVRNNRLIVSQGENMDKLYAPSAEASEATWISGEAPGRELDCMVRLRHRQPLQKAHIVIEGDHVHMDFAEKQRAVTPGQSAVFYLDQVCLGGAIID